MKTLTIKILENDYTIISTRRGLLALAWQALVTVIYGQTTKEFATFDLNMEIIQTIPLIRNQYA